MDGDCAGPEFRVNLSNYLATGTVAPDYAGNEVDSLSAAHSAGTSQSRQGFAEEDA